MESAHGHQRPAAASGTFEIAGELPVHRLGFGAMRITGPDTWSEPSDRAGAIRVVRRAVELGVTLIDTADSYGPSVSEEIIAEALYPYPSDLVVATKGGFERPGPGAWRTNGRPDHLREALEGSLRRLRVDCIDLYQLHRIDPDVPWEESIGALVDLRAEGKVRHLGLSEVGVDEIEAVRTMTPIVTVQNRYNVADRKWEPVLEHCATAGIGFFPWFPIAGGELAAPEGPIGQVARKHGATAVQVSLAWLLRHSPVLLPIPGTSSVAHLEENMAAAALELDDADLGVLDRL
jgi:pyridoxine 4-dehydrogenase